LNGGDPDSEADALAACSFPDELLAEPELRSEDSGGLASRVSIHPAVRNALLGRQRAFASQPGGAVIDGRDIGTVIAPQAEVKLFVTANISARAQRRFQEMQDAGRSVSLAEIAADLEARDYRDASRTAAPLIAAHDAVVLDTTLFNRDEAIARAIALVALRQKPQ
jgi:cytidylate kinase